LLLECSAEIILKCYKPYQIVANEKHESFYSAPLSFGIWRRIFQVGSAKVVSIASNKISFFSWWIEETSYQQITTRIHCNIVVLKMAFGELVFEGKYKEFCWWKVNNFYISKLFNWNTANSKRAFEGELFSFAVLVFTYHACMSLE